MKSFKRSLGLTLVAGVALLVANLSTPVCAAGQQQNAPAQPTSTPPAKNATGKNQKQGKAAKADANKSLECDSRMPVHQFVVDASGAVNDSGRTFEGPLCVKVFYNPIQSYVSLASTTTTTNGPDLNKVVTGATAQGGGFKAPSPTNIFEDFGLLQKRAEGAQGRLQATRTSFGTALKQQETAIAKISLLRRTTKLRSSSQVIEEVRNGYKDLKEDLQTATTGLGAYYPTDEPGRNSEQPLLFELQEIADRLSRLPIIYSGDGAKTNQPISRCGSELRLKRDSRTEFEFDPQKSDSRSIFWADWSSRCKADYDQLKADLDRSIQDAKNYTAASDNTKNLKGKAAIVQYWDSLFSDMGLRTSMSMKEIDQQDISGSFNASTAVKCGILFNQNSNTAVNIVAADLGPTLEGKDPEIKAQGAFVTVSCGTPFSISAGIAFSTISQQEFAIIKSSGGAGNPSINTFGVVNDASITPLPMVMANVRLWDSTNHKYAFHGSFGVGGNLQNQASGGSSADFLPAGTVSFWRTMYVSFGPEIGTKSQLAGNFKVGDVVPSDITTIQGQVKRSRTVGFGFAITFTKP